MENIEKAMEHLDAGGREVFQRTPIPFEAFLQLLVASPGMVIRNVFQLFYDMIQNLPRQSRNIEGAILEC